MAPLKSIMRTILHSRSLQIAIVIVAVVSVYLFYNLNTKSNFSSVNEQYRNKLNGKSSQDNLSKDKDRVLSVSENDEALSKNGKSGNALKEDDFIDVFITFTNAENNYNLQEKFKITVQSMLRFATIPINLHILGDDKSETIAKGILKQYSGPLKYKITHLQINDLTKQVHSIIGALQQYFSYKPGAYYSDSLFFLSIVIHKVLPHHRRVIMLDADLKFNADIRQLYAMFNNFTDDNIMGIGRDLQPVYRHNFHMYRNKNKGTRVGAPPPDGLTGFNSGVLLLDLDRMRKSELYNSLISKDVIQRLVEKYSFKGHLGDQDFCTLMLLENEQLFYVLPCSWNRQLCQWWRKHGYEDVFEEYYACEGHINIYHGNCGTPIPKLSWEQD